MLWNDILLLPKFLLLCSEDGQVTHEQTPSPTEELISKQDDVTPEEPVPVEATSQEVETEDVQVKDDTKDAWDAESEEEKEDGEIQSYHM